MVYSFFFELIQIAVGSHDRLSIIPSTKQWTTLFEESKRQAITGVVLGGLEQLSKKQRPGQDLLLQWIGIGQMIQYRNSILNNAVVGLCKQLDDSCARYFMVKGQTLAPLYPNEYSRQCGDIDFMVHPKDWDKVYSLYANKFGVDALDSHSEKHVEWETDGILYEMHRWLNDFASKKHQKYWDNVVMKEVWEHPFSVEINGYNVPTLAPTYNAIYVFVHLFYHLINGGGGLRQFIDWYYILDRYNEEIDIEILDKHLKNIGLYDAFVGVGTVLTDYLGMPVRKFPFEVSERYHQDSYKLVENILNKGNFGHNTHYVHSHGVIHGMQQFWQVVKQCVKFGHYAPSESWGYLWIKIRWWGRNLIKV